MSLASATSVAAQKHTHSFQRVFSLVPNGCGASDLNNVSPVGHIRHLCVHLLRNHSISRRNLVFQSYPRVHTVIMCFAVILSYIPAR